MLDKTTVAILKLGIMTIEQQQAEAAMHYVDITPARQSQASRQHREAVQDMSAGVPASSLAEGVLRLVDPANDCLYRLTPERQRWSNLLGAAAQLPGVTVVVTYYKKCGELRTMMCRPIQGLTAVSGKYATAWDIESGGYRMVNLDTIVKLSLETHSFNSSGDPPGASSNP